MTTDINDESSHLLDISDTTLKFLSKEGASGWPTVLAILNRFLMDKSINGWYKNSGIIEETAPKLGDNIHWYKILNDNRSNFKLSVTESILKYGALFEKATDIPEILSNCSFAFTTKNKKYLIVSSNLYGFELNDDAMELSENSLIQTAFGSNVIDALSIGGCDYILTSNALFSIYNKVCKSICSGSFKSMCSNYTNTIILAGSSGGIKLSVNSSGSSSSQTNIVYSSSSSGSEGGTSETSTNHMPENNSCDYCVTVGSDFYIGNSRICAKFKMSASSFDTDDGDGTVLYSGPVFNFGNNQFCKDKSGKAVLNGEQTNIGITPNTTNGNGVIVACSNDGLYLIDLKNSSKMNGINERTDFIIDINNKTYVKSSSGYYKEKDNNGLKLYTFNLDFDKEADSDKIDVGNIKLSFSDIKDLNSDNSSVFSNKIETLNGRKITYAIGISDNGNGVTDFSLYGTDERNKAAIEMKACMDAFGMKA